MYFSTAHQIHVVSRKKAGGTLNHWGVQLPNGRVAHFLPDCGVIVTSPEEFADGQDVETIRTISSNHYQLVLERLHMAQTNPRRYDLLNWNCQSFANWLVGENPESPDAKGWVLIAALIAFLGIAARMR